MSTEPTDTLALRRGNRFLWQTVMDVLERDIRSGTLQPGQQIATERELASRFGVHENTIRRAISHMQERGLVRGERGRGMYVRDDIMRYPLGPMTRQSSAFKDAHRTVQREFLGARTVRAAVEIAAALRIPTGAYVKKIDVLNWADGRPSSLGIFFYPLPRFHGIEHKIKAYGSVTQALRDYGIENYRRLEAIVRPTILTPREAALLQQKRSKPSLKMFNTNVAPDGTPIQASYGIEASWIELVVRFDENGPMVERSRP